MLWSDQRSPCNYFSLCHVQAKIRPRYATYHEIMTRNLMASQLDIPEPDLESGPRTASLPSNRAYPISVSSNLPNRAPLFSAYSSLPSRAQASLHDRTHNHLRSIGSTPQCATNQFQDFAMFVPALTYAAVEPSPEPTIELYQVTHSANFISYNRSWG